MEPEAWPWRKASLPPARPFLSPSFLSPHFSVGVGGVCWWFGVYYTPLSRIKLILRLTSLQGSGNGSFGLAIAVFIQPSDLYLFTSYQLRVVCFHNIALVLGKYEKSLKQSNATDSCGRNTHVETTT